jgi:hypothetical protein
MFLICPTKQDNSFGTLGHEPEMRRIGWISPFQARLKKI